MHAVQRETTPGLVLGPFYPVERHADPDHRLWRGATVPAGARRLRFGGRVLDSSGAPLRGAQVELWHADPAGRYRHPAACGHAEVDPDFLGYGVKATDADGGFAFDSLAPGCYVTANGMRAMHLHLQITGRAERLLTQVFLPGDPHLGGDRWLRSATRPALLLARVLADEAAGLQLDWTAVLARG